MLNFTLNMRYYPKVSKLWCHKRNDDSDLLIGGDSVFFCEQFGMSLAQLACFIVNLRALE
jgi:hypothetical protein